MYLRKVLLKMRKIQYPPKSSVALGYLRSRNNEIEIYVEDTACKFVWENLIEIANVKKYKIKNINRMGGKENVINACINDQSDKKRKRLYIVDGDLDKITGKRYKKLNFFYKIKSYCIENILVDESEILKLAKISCSDDEIGTIERKLNYNVFDENISKLKSLFLIFGIIQRNKLGIVNVSMGVTDFISHENKKAIIDGRKIFKKILLLSREIIAKIGYDKYYSEISRVKKISKNIDHMNIVSGKDYIIPFLVFYFHGRIKYKNSHDVLKKYLSANCNFSKEPGLKKAISSM